MVIFENLILINRLPAVDNSQVNSVGVINVTVDNILDKPMLTNTNGTD